MKNLSLLSFLKQSKEQALGSITLFSAREYPLLFFSYLCSFLKQQFAVENMIVSEHEWPLVQSSLETTFLGQSRMVWLGNVSACDASKKKKSIAFIKSYQGPHKLLYFLEKDDLADQVAIDLDANYTQQMIAEIAIYFFGTSKSLLVESLKNLIGNISLEKIMILLQYNVVVGNNTEAFKEEWYGKIISPDESLFVLSQYFFAKKKELFYKEWEAIKDSYDPVFWTTFWSEQLWKGYFFKVLKEKNDLTKAKQVGFRLPFSFLQKDFQKHSHVSLLRAHALICEIDTGIKRGAATAGLDFFYASFFE